jgi:DHA1 family tetracycline resistance protein-like MFS transporter
MLKKISLNKEQFTILIIMITETLGFSLILPFLPFFAMDFGATPFEIGLVISCFSLFQFFSAPVLGRLSDHFGRKPLLILSQFSTFVGFIILGFANSLELILLSRIIDGLFGSNFVIAEAYLSDISTKAERSKAFAISGVAFGVGFLIGPAIGGLLSTLGIKYLAFGAALISLASITLSFAFLKETVKKADHSFKKVFKNIKFIETAQIKGFLFQATTSRKMLAMFFYVFSNVLFISVFSLFVEKKFSFTARDVGFILAYVGITSLLLRLVIMPFSLKLLSEKKLTVAAFAIYLSGILGLALGGSFFVFLVFVTCFTIGTGLLRPLIQASLSVVTSDAEQGALLGVTNSLGSISQIFGPAIGTSMLQHGGSSAVMFLTFAVAFAGLVSFLSDLGFGRVFKYAKSKIL